MYFVSFTKAGTPFTSKEVAARRRVLSIFDERRLPCLIHLLDAEVGPMTESVSRAGGIVLRRGPDRDTAFFWADAQASGDNVPAQGGAGELSRADGFNSENIFRVCQ